MQRLLLAAALLATVGLVARADEKDAKKPDEKKDEKANLMDLQKEFIGKFQAAKGDEKAQQAAMTEYGPKFMKIAEAEGKSKDGFGAVMMAAQIAFRSKNAEMKKKAAALLKQHHADSDQLNARSLQLIGLVLADEARPLLKEIMKNGKDAAIKKAAFEGLLQGAENALLDAKDDEAKQLEKDLAEYRKVGLDKYKMKDLFIGSKMPDLKSEDLKGKEVKLSDYKGKVVVLDIWATWCPPCKAMIPHERKLVERLKGKPFELISVSFDDKKETLEKFLEDEKMPWTHWFNGRSGEIGKTLGIRAFPTIYVLDGKGVIRFKGPRGEAMDKAVDKLLKEMGDTKKSS